jgi:hypothetical protein
LRLRVFDRQPLMLEQRSQPEVERDLAREVELPVLAAAHEARERADDVRKRSHQCRVAAERARWRSKKQHLRGRRLRVRSDQLCAPRLDEFVEIASVDELVEVLVLISERGRGDGSDDDGRLSA